MINVKHLSYTVKKHRILNDISCELPDVGLVALVGPSGSGKTTFLNCLSGLINYQGTIEHDGVDIIKQNSDVRDLFRIKRFGYIFQQYNLYENLSVEDNIFIPYQAICKKLNNKNLQLKIEEILTLIGIAPLRKKIVNKLSGGEKQRVAIARAIINNPKVVFADEPTGALDKENSIKIMDILNRVSSKALVLVVTHDIDLIKKYATKVLKINDGQIVSIDNFKQKKAQPLRSKIKLPIGAHKTKIHFNFLFRYTASQIKIHRLKTLLSGLVCSLGMLSLGLSFSLSSIISNSVVSAYSGLIENDRVVIKKRDSQPINNRCALNEAEVFSLAQKYPQYVDDIGICYQANFEEIFEDKNNLTFQVGGLTKIIPGFGARQINDFLWLDYENIEIFPRTETALEDDEIILGLTFGQIKYICEALQIKQSIESLGEYIDNHGLDVVYDFAHYDWEYEDKQMLNVKGICLTKTATLYHSNHLWNKKMLEDNMRFPTKDDFDLPPTPPWTLSKAFYYKLNCLNNEFIDFARYQRDFDYVNLEVANKTYFTNSLASQNEMRILLFCGTSQDLIFRYITYFEDIIDGLKYPIFGSNNGYAIYPEQMMSGFANLMFFSNDEEKIIEISDLYDYLDEDERNEIIMAGVYSGHFTKTTNDGVSFAPINEGDILLKGRYPKDYSEIIVSSDLYENIKNNEDSMYFSCKKPTFSEKSDFYIGSLKIVGVINDNTKKLYHFKEWPLTFFQSIIGISIFDLSLQTISYKTNSSFNMSIATQKLNKTFPKLELINPLSDVIISAQQVGNNIQIFLLILSILVLIISLFIIIQSLGLYFDRIKKDIGIARIIGISKDSCSGFINSYIGFILFGAFIFSSFELVILSLFCSLSLGQDLGVSFIGFLNPISFVAMLLFGIMINLCVYMVVKKRACSISALECLKR